MDRRVRDRLAARLARLIFGNEAAIWLAPVMARAAVALGVAGVFIETHQDPDNAPSDGPNMVYLDRMPALIGSLMDFDALAKSDPVMGEA